MLEKLKSLFVKQEVKQEPPQTKAKQPRKKKIKEQPQEQSEKEKLTQAGEPYISIVKVEVDPENINSGNFELDWNDKFVLNLIKAGYKQREDDTDQVIVDRWFQTVCRNVALEMYEQTQADPENRYRGDVRSVYSKNIGNGRSEVS